MNLESSLDSLGELAMLTVKFLEFDGDLVHWSASPAQVKSLRDINTLHAG